MLGSCLHGLCAFPNMVSDGYVIRRSGKNQETKNKYVVDILIMLMHCLHSLCAFLNILSDVNKARKWEKKEEAW